MTDLPAFPVLEARGPAADSGAAPPAAAALAAGKRDVPTLLVDGRAYAGWLELRATRGLERCAADFDMGIVEQFPGQATAWPLGPFTPLQLVLGDDPVITGHVDVWAPTMDATNHALRVAGRSKTADLIDCCPAEGTGEFRASALEAIARAMAAPYGIDVENRSGVTAPVPLAAYKRSDTCFEILEKLARQQGVFLSDGNAGQLIIARGPALDAVPVADLVEGKNILSARLKVDVSKRFSRYETRSQQPVAASVSLNPVGGRPVIDGLSDGNQGSARRAQQPATRSITDASGAVTDADVPRLRLRVMEQETAGNGVSAAARATWECATSAGRSVRCEVVVQGWRRPDGGLWAAGDTVALRLPSMRLKRNMAVAQVTWQLNDNGTRTVLELCPPEGLLPEPLPPPASARRAAAVPLNNIRGTAALPIEGDPR